MLQKGRDFKIFLKKLKKALNNDDKVKTASLEEHRPMYTLDRIVKERYPTFIDALRDIDDALTLTTLYASLSSQKTKVNMIDRWINRLRWLFLIGCCKSTLPEVTRRVYALCNHLKVT